MGIIDFFIIRGFRKYMSSVILTHFLYTIHTQEREIKRKRRDEEKKYYKTAPV
jgi:hypothetical protein